MTNQQYHADTSRVSKSGLDLINKAPALYYERYLNPNRKKSTKRNAALVFGSAFHTYILEPNKIDNEIAVQPIFAGKGSRQKKTDWEDENRHKTVITQSEYSDLIGMKNAVYAHPIASKLLFSGDSEVEVNWIDEQTGVKCKCRMDFFNSSRYIIDLKSARDASDYGFQKQARSHRYHVQDAFYFDGATKKGFFPKGFIFISVEKEPPYLVNVHAYNEFERQESRDIYREDLNTYKECKEYNIWPGYEPTIKPLTIKY
jgi:exodeoxyribonuclease VIII